MLNVTKKILMSISLLTVSLSVVADDIDIINEEPIAADTNVLFIMDVSGSMDWDTSGTEGVFPGNAADSRLGKLRTALGALLADSDLDGINIGLSSFSGNATRDFGDQAAHGITYPVTAIGGDAETVLDSNPLFDHPSVDDATVSFFPATGGAVAKSYLQAVSNASWASRGGTPIVDALYEAALYFRGLPVKWGRYDPIEIRSAHPSTYTGLIYNQRTVNVGTQSVESSVILPGQNCNPYTGTSTCHLGSVAACNAAPEYSSCNTITYPPGSSCYTPCGGRRDEFGNCLNPLPLVCNPTSGGSYITCNKTKYKCDSVTLSPIGVASYKSPIIDKCPANGMILLSDGEPSMNNSSGLVTSLIGAGYSAGCDSGSSEGRCGPELLSFLANEDNNASVAGKQTIKTFTIGLALGTGSTAADYLKELAAAGDGTFVNASTVGGIAAAFKAAIHGISDKKARSFSSPSYSVDGSTRLTNGNVVYVPVFDRGGGGLWSGNLKKYELKDGDLYGFTAGGVSVKATDSTGTLKEDIKDHWATAASTHAVRSGGAANILPNPSSRKVYTDASVSSYPSSLNGHKLRKGNSSITKTLLGDASMNSAYRKKIINFIRGKNADGTTRYHMGDTIHSIPTQLVYKHGGNNKTAVFLGTNEGFLHGFDGDSGSEIFAFMPKELIPSIKDQFESVYNVDHNYGVDGAITLWLDETGAGATPNGILDRTAGEKAYLFFGLRRGGKSYYAMDVTKPKQPVLLWKKDDSNLSGLGFTWSKPTMAKLKYKQGGVVRDDQVLVFGGGYVDDHAGEAVDSGTGANVFIINAITGARIFDVNTDITTKVPLGSSLGYAIPTDIRVMDIDRNGSIDRLYFGDMGGNIWRVDLNASGADPYNLSKAQLTKFAALGGTGSADRKFFSEPDTALFKSKGNYVFSLSIGSGSRPDPLGVTVDDYFFTIFDENIYRPPPIGFTSITPADLIDAPSAVSLVGHASKEGWKYNLNPVPGNPSSSATGLSGEKVLSKAITFQNNVLFTTFGVDSLVTTTMNGVTCAVENRNKARLYALDVLTGKAALDLNGDNSLNNTADSSVEISSGEIPTTPKVVFNNFESSNGGACTKDDCVRSHEIRAGRGAAVANEGTLALNPIPADKNLPRVYWIDQEK